MGVTLSCGWAPFCSARQREVLWESQALPPALRRSVTVTQVHPWRLSGRCIKITEEKGGSEFGYLSQHIPNPCFWQATRNRVTTHTQSYMKGGSNIQRRGR